MILLSFQNDNFNRVLLSVGIADSTRSKFWSRIFSEGYYPIYKSAPCCWNCFPCPCRFVKPIAGQSSCLKCMNYSISNENQTTCLSPVYKYYKLHYN